MSVDGVGLENNKISFDVAEKKEREKLRKVLSMMQSSSIIVYSVFKPSNNSH